MACQEIWFQQIVRKVVDQQEIFKRDLNKNNAPA